jgi:flagellar protein FlaJ
MLRKYANFCYDLVGSLVLPYVDIFEGLRPQITKADIEVSLPEYVSLMFVTSGLVSLFILFVVGTLMFLSQGITGLVLTTTLSILSGAATIVGFYVYPSLIITSRASQIRDTLPFATMYLSTLAGTGTSLSEIFSNLAEVEEYGEVAREAEKIDRDIKTFGMDVSEAIKRAAERTPSEDFRELMWGLNHVLTTGGTLRDFLQQRSKSLMDDYQRRVEEFADSLSLLVEMYITVVIVGSIVFTSMSAVMTTFTQMSPSVIVTIQLLTIFVGLPLVSGMFILLIQGLSPGGIR